MISPVLLASFRGLQIDFRYDRVGRRSVCFQSSFVDESAFFSSIAYVSRVSEVLQHAYGTRMAVVFVLASETSTSTALLSF